MSARAKWFALVGVRLLGAAGALVGVVLLGKARGWPYKVLGVAIVLSALWMTFSVTGHLAHRWRSPEA